MLSLNPPHQITGFDGPTTTLQGMVRAVQGTRGEASLRVRTQTEEVIGELWPKDYVGEVVAIADWVSQRIRYVNDPMHVELLKDPQRLVEEVQERGFARGDCDDMACLIATMCLQVGRHAQFVVVGFGESGQYTHVFTRVQEPKSQKWIVCDPVAGSDVGGMLGRVTTFEVWSTDELPEKGPVEAR
jgi:hypothetical protein